MRRGKLFMALILGIVTFVAGSAGSQDGASLYKRLGGYDAIAAVTDDFIGRLAGDPVFQPFFTGLGTDSKKRLRQLVVEQVCEAAGGPCHYTGRDMKTAHAGLNITAEQWDASVNHLTASLDKFKVGETEKKELLTVVASLKADIVAG
jgi:hemoglobin